jgi:hypothetical protein
MSWSCRRAQDGVGPDALQNIVHPRQNSFGDIEERLSVLHDVQIIIGRHGKDREHLVEHFPCCAVTQTIVCSSFFFSSMTRGHILIASGLVPKTSIIFFISRSLPRGA